MRWPAWPSLVLLAGALQLPVTCAAIAEEATAEMLWRTAESRLQQALEQAGELPRTEALVRRAEVKFFLAEIMAEAPTAERLALYREGKAAAARALDREPGHREARLWHAVNALGEMKLARTLSALWRIKEVRDAMQALAEEAPQFEHAAGDRVLASIYFRAPRFISIGSAEKAEQHFRRALDLAPDFPANTLLYAEFLISEGRAQEAREMLRTPGLVERMAEYPLYEMLWRLDLMGLEERLAR